jgi:hypothetical protein
LLSWGPRGLGTAKIDSELKEGIAGVAVTPPPVERKRSVQSTPAAMDNARKQANPATLIGDK